MTATFVYHISPSTFEYYGADPAIESPLEPGVFLLPGYATFTEPPIVSENQKQVWQDEEWIIVSDYRGKSIYNQVTKEENFQRALGDVAEGWSLTKPGEFDKWDNGSWAYDPTQDPSSPLNASAALKSKAQETLDRSDTVVIRCSEKAKALPDDWVQYRQTLRDIVSGKSAGPLPDQPASYP